MKLSKTKINRMSAVLSLQWSRVNQAWFLLWGSGPISEQAVLQIINDDYEALELFNKHKETATKEA